MKCRMNTVPGFIIKSISYLPLRDFFYGKKVYLSAIWILLLSTNILAQKDSIAVQNQEWQTFESYKDVGYHQTLRPQFHFSSLKNWINDPNGMVYYDGEYHLYFQHNPVGIKWGNMTWGHAVSADMVHWKQLPHAILPYGKSAIFSGSAVVDEQNMLGKQVGKTKTIVAIYTAWGNGQAGAYSTDKGRSFQLLNNGGPIVKATGINKGERDPSIFWHEASKKWIMVLWIKRAANEGSAADKMGKVRIFTSPNLTDWTMASDFDREWVYECVNLIELPVDGNKKNKKWVVFDAGFHYEIGDFDGKALTTDSIALQGDFGKNYYAAQTFNNSPDGRKVLIGWMSGSNGANEKEGMPFSGQFSFPSKLDLRNTKAGIRLFRWPIKEIESLYTHSYQFKNLHLDKVSEKLAQIKAELIDFSIEFEPIDSLKLTLRGLDISYNKSIASFAYGKFMIPAPIREDGKVILRVLIDRSSIELFANEGASVASFFAVPKADELGVAISGNGDTKITSLVVHELKSVWK